VVSSSAARAVARLENVMKKFFRIVERCSVHNATRARGWGEYACGCRLEVVARSAEVATGEGDAASAGVKTAIYDPRGGEAIPDAFAEARAVEWWIEGPETITVSTENFIEALRALVAEEAIAHDQLRLSFNGESMSLDKRGRPARFPRGFLDTVQGFITRILEASLGRRRVRVAIAVAAAAVEDGSG
jgi:hypothetical protein